jgi:hypothetical protein
MTHHTHSSGPPSLPEAAIVLIYVGKGGARLLQVNYTPKGHGHALLLDKDGDQHTLLIKQCSFAYRNAPDWSDANSVHNLLAALGVIG